MEKNLYNPLFESFLEKAKKYQTTEVNEQAEEKLDVASASRYVQIIVSEWASNIMKFVQSSPDDLKALISPATSEGISKLGNNASIDDLVEGLTKMWNDVMAKVGSYKRQSVKDAFSEADKGFKKLSEAYNVYKQKAGTVASNPDILKKINEKMSDYVKNAQQSIALATAKSK